MGVFNAKQRIWIKQFATAMVIGVFGFMWGLVADYINFNDWFFRKMGGISFRGRIEFALLFSIFILWAIYMSSMNFIIRMKDVTMEK